MIKVEIENSKKGIEIILNNDGISELINYLNFLRENKDDFHLSAGNELEEKPSQNGNDIITHVKLIYIN